MIVENLQGNVEDEAILNIFDSETDEVSKQYKRCCSEENQRVLLLKEGDGIAVGFCGFLLFKENRPPSLDFWFSVEYVFIKPDYRNKEHSFKFIEQIAAEVEVFVAENMGKGEHKLVSRADVISDEGVRFMAYINHILKSISDKNRVEFVNATP